MPINPVSAMFSTPLTAAARLRVPVVIDVTSPRPEQQTDKATRLPARMGPAGPRPDKLISLWPSHTVGGVRYYAQIQHLTFTTTRSRIDETV